MNPDETQICQYLKSYPHQFVSRKEICRRAGGKWRFREDENWAAPVLQRMLECHLVETDSTGHFRLAERALQNKKRWNRLWLSPAIKNILRQSGRDFPVIDLDQEVDSVDLTANSEACLYSPLEDPNQSYWPPRR